MSSRVVVEKDITEHLAKGLGPKVSSLVYNAALYAENKAKGKINSGSKTGRVYTQEVSFTTKSGKAVSFTMAMKLRPYPHQASAPGESPANWTGQLANSIEAIRTGTYSSEVRVGSNHGAALELGTADGKLAARPFLFPAVEETVPWLEDQLLKLLEV
jgi:hypothetical protein